MKQYSDLIPEGIDPKGDFFYSYCNKCKCERTHFVFLLKIYTIEHTVDFTMVCCDCFEASLEFDQATKDMNISENHGVTWTTICWRIFHWNEFISNSMVPSDELPYFIPNVPKEILEEYGKAEKE